MSNQHLFNPVKVKSECNWFIQPLQGGRQLCKSLSNRQREKRANINGGKQNGIFLQEYVKRNENKGEEHVNNSNDQILSASFLPKGKNKGIMVNRK